MRRGNHCGHFPNDQKRALMTSSCRISTPTVKLTDTAVAAHSGDIEMSLCCIAKMTMTVMLAIKAMALRRRYTEKMVHRRLRNRRLCFLSGICSAGMGFFSRMREPDLEET